MRQIFRNFKLMDFEIESEEDLLVEDGLIVGMGHFEEDDAQIIDGQGLLLTPAFCDLHVHFRDPGFTQKETLETGSRAALKGGYTTVNLMGNTKPTVSDMEVYRDIKKRAEELDLVDIEQVVTITKNFDGKTLDHWDTPDERVRFLSEDGHGVDDDLIMYKAMKKAKKMGLGLMLHEEQKQFSPFDYRIGEDLMTLRDAYLAQATGARVHFSHVSTRDSLDFIRRAKRVGADVTCEVTPHHIRLSGDSYRVNPPIRTEDDREAILEAILDGTVDAIATDHAPHTKEEKEAGAPGLIGLESAFSICYEELVLKAGIPLKKLFQLLSKTPHEILSYKKGQLKPGYAADFAILDLNREYLFDESEIASKSSNTPFLGQRLKGKVVATWKSGIKKWEE